MTQWLFHVPPPAREWIENKTRRTGALRGIRWSVVCSPSASTARNIILRARSLDGELIKDIEVMRNGRMLV